VTTQQHTVASKMKFQQILVLWALLVILTPNGVFGQVGIWDRMDAEFATQKEAEINRILKDNERKSVTGEYNHGNTEIKFDDKKRSTEAVEQFSWVPGIQLMGSGYDWVYGANRAPVVVLNNKYGRTYSSPYDRQTYSLADEVFILNSPSATMSEDVQSYASIYEYQKAKASKIGISVSIWSNGVFSKNSNTMRINGYMTTSASQWTTVERTYTYYTMNMLPPKYLTINQEVKDELAALPRFDDSTLYIYKNFFQKYGTHVVISALFGGSMKHESLLSMSTMGARNPDWITEQLQYWWNWMTATDPNQKALYQSYLDPNFVPSNSMERFTYEGGNTEGLAPSDWQRWKPTITTNPVMVTLRVQPLTEFIDDLVLKADVEKAMFEYAEEVRRVVYPRPRDNCGEEYESRVDYKRDVEATMIRWDGRTHCLKKALQERFRDVPDHVILPNPDLLASFNLSAYAVNFADVSRGAAVVSSSSVAKVCREVNTYVYYKKIVCEERREQSELIQPNHPDTYFMFASEDTDQHVVVDLAERRYLTSVGAKVSLPGEDGAVWDAVEFYTSLDNVNWELWGRVGIRGDNVTDITQRLNALSVIKPRAVRYVRVNFGAAGSNSVSGAGSKIFSILAYGPESDLDQSVGYMERASESVVRGWAVNLLDFDRPVTVQIYAGKLMVGQGTTTIERPELNERIQSTGLHGFSVPLSFKDDQEGCYWVRARFIGFNKAWTESDRRRVCVFAPPGRLTGANLQFAEGWAYDRNKPSYDVPIDVMVNGKLYASGLANLASPVVNRVHNITGSHAFRIPLNITAYGTHTVTAVATINGRRRPLMGSFDLSIKYPRGSLEQVSATGVVGWAINVEQPTEPALVSVHVDGIEYVRVPTNVPRPEVNQNLGLAGNHGFNIALNLTGYVHHIAVYVVMPERLVSLGEKIVQVPFNMPRTRSIQQGANPLVSFLESGFDGLSEEFRLPLFEFRYNRGRKFQSPYSDAVWNVPDELSITANPSIEVVDESRYSENVFQYLEMKKKKKGWSIGFFGSSKVTMTVQQRLSKTTSRYVNHDRFYRFFNTRMMPGTFQLSGYATPMLNALPPYSINTRPAYDEFFTYFGTHFISRGVFGGRIAMTLDVDTSVLLDSSQTFVQKQTGFTFGFLISLSLTFAKADYESKLDIKFRASSNKEIKFIGGTPELYEIDQADQWAETIKDNPVMIDYELKEISELITDPVRRSDMHTAILDYMAKNWDVGVRCYTRTNFAVDGYGARVASYSSIYGGAPYDAVLNLIRSVNYVWGDGEQGFIFGDGDQDQRVVIDLGQIRYISSIGVHVSTSEQNRGVWDFIRARVSVDGGYYSEWFTWGEQDGQIDIYDALNDRSMINPVAVRYIEYSFGPASGDGGARIFDVYANGCNT
jgi:hypothetical protein